MTTSFDTELLTLLLFPIGEYSLVIICKGFSLIRIFGEMLGPVLVWFSTFSKVHAELSSH